VDYSDSDDESDHESTPEQEAATELRHDILVSIGMA
jgi:hypothetical protein